MKHRWFKSACDLVIPEIPAPRKAGGALEAAHRGEFCTYLGKRGYLRKGHIKRNTVACAASGKSKARVCSRREFIYLHFLPAKHEAI